MHTKPITIYTTKTCGYCKATKAFLTEYKLKFDEIDVGADSSKAREMIEKSGQMGVPVTIIGEGNDATTIIGFDKEALVKALHITL